MKKILLYGPGEVEKRQALARIKAKFDHGAITILDGKKLQDNEVQTILRTSDLFQTNDRLIVIENPSDSFGVKLLPNDLELTIVLLADNLKSTSKLLQAVREGGFEIYQFQLEQELSAFPFVDSLLEKRPVVFLELEKLLAHMGSGYVLSMVYYAIRRNLLPLPASGFLAGKIERQRRGFSAQDWLRLYQGCLKTEYSIKTGHTEERTALYQLLNEFLRSC